MTSKPDALRVHRCTVIVDSIKDAAREAQQANDIGPFIAATAAAVQELAGIVAEI
jgi:hypothetical protein